MRKSVTEHLRRKARIALKHILTISSQQLTQTSKRTSGKTQSLYKTAPRVEGTITTILQR